jgi:hypothetical protein
MTKIDGIIPGVTPDQTSKPGRSAGQPATSFQELLDQAVQKNQVASESPGIGAEDVIGVSGVKPPVLDGVLSPLHTEGVMRAERTLELLEHYEQVLGDSGKSLKEVSRAVEALDGEARELAGVLDRLDPGDELFPILQDVAVTAMVQSIKFNRGDFNPS